MRAAYLAEKFDQALPYDDYVRTGTTEQQRRWVGVYTAARLTPAQLALIHGFERTMRVLVVSGIWCGDCVEQCPLLARCAEANPARIDVRFLDRDLHRDLSERLRINAGDRVPVAMFLAEDFELCATFGDRTLNRYRALAAKKLGTSCPIGVIPPGADELAATLQDWLNEIERVQLLLRLSGRLRQLHGD